MDLLHQYNDIEQSRNGEVYVAPTPVITKWYYPDRRVLLDTYRNCNHAFHINEAIWMLRGEKNPLVLDRFIHDFSTRFAEPDGGMHGAYGHRWLQHFNFDQIATVINILTKDPTSRQAVIQMWDAASDLRAVVKDKPCNTQLMFRIKNNALDMTVCNRSNDIIWGLYGANAIHFSMLHELMSAKIGVHLGFMYTLSNNFHAYRKLFDKLYKVSHQEWNEADYIPLCNEDSALFFQDCESWDYGVTRRGFKTRWFNEVAIPVTKAFLAKKYRDYPEMETWLGNILDENWYAGMRQWCHQGEVNGPESA